MRLSFDLNNKVEIPEIILGKRNYDKLGSITNITNLVYDYDFISANSISFVVQKTLNEKQERLWEEIKERRCIWLKEFDEWFQIDVTESDNGEITKEIVGTSLCEAELSQILITAEINTEDDIAREDYLNPTVFYKPSNINESLLHRLIKKVPHYSIAHVDTSLWNIQRTFSISEANLYDTLTGEIAEEIGCLFVFNSSDRSISVYDLKTNCNGCGNRGDYNDACLKCGSTNLDYGYGRDTTIFVDSETLGQDISLVGKQDEVKNYFKVSGGDDDINAAIAACNPNGTQYIYHFSNRDREDMSDGLIKKLDAYISDYETLTPKYQGIMEDYFDKIDGQLYLESVMMPDITMAETTAEKELAKLTSINLNPVAVTNLSTASVYTVNNAVLGMAKCIVNSSVYKIEIITSSFSDTTWKGKFTIANYSDENDIASNKNTVSLTITDNYNDYIQQKVKKTIDKSDIYLVDIFNNSTSLSSFKTELKKYCLNRLISFESAYQTVIDTLIEENCGNSSVYSDLYTNMYEPYYNKLVAIQSEIKIRNEEIEDVQTALNTLEKSRQEITNSLNLETYLGQGLWEELCSFIREDTYKNENYISDGLNSSEIFSKAKELIKTAEEEIKTASALQLTLSATLFNLLAIPAFKKLTGMFEGGNWLRVALNNKIYKLRLIHFTIDFENLENIKVEFSETTQTAYGLNDTKNLMDKLKSMSTSFDYVAHQAEQGEKSFTEIDKIRNEGLNAALYNITTNSINQDFTMNEHGITGKKWDDILGDYCAEQIKINNNSLVYTNDYWVTAKCALGKIEYYNPILKTNISEYGLIADAVIAGMLMGNDIIGGNIYSVNYSTTSGTHLDLNNGDFSFAGGKLAYDSASNVVNVTGKITFENISYASNDAKLAVKNSLGITDIESDVSNANSIIGDLKKCLGFSTEISSDYIISPYIGGGYLKITNPSNGEVLIDPSNVNKKGYIFGIYNTSGSLVMGVDTNGNGTFKGNVTAISGTIGGCSISKGKLIVPSANISGTITADKVNAASGTIDTVTATNLTVTSGKITLGNTVLASTGNSTIGGFVIGSTAIYNGTNSLKSLTSGIYLGIDGIRQYKSSSAYVNIANGILTAQGAKIEGNITASEGSIGGINITTNGLYYSGTSATDGFGIWKNGVHSNDSSYVIFHAGANNSNIGSAKFRVYQNGNVVANSLIATNATISGVLTAGQGSSLGGFKTDNNSIYYGSWSSSTPPEIFMCTGSNSSYSIGGSSSISGWCFAAGKTFGVTKNGAMYCSAGMIGGWSVGSGRLYSEASYILNSGEFCFSANGGQISFGSDGILSVSSGTIRVGNTTLTETNLKNLLNLL